jgi:hypothetical protein
VKESKDGRVEEETFGNIAPKQFFRQALFQIDNSLGMHMVARSADNTLSKTSCTEIVQSVQQR